MRVGNLVRDTRGNYQKAGVVVGVVNDYCWVEFPSIGKLWVAKEFLEVLSE
tara:strand:- start:9 stop:161 length:153 start_codon:yes stop_codon:yes gene_type:complete